MKKENNVNVDAPTMDDDSETFAKVCNELTHNVEKWGDQNHTAKCIRNSLCVLEKNYKTLSDKIIKHIQQNVVKSKTTI